MLKTDFLKGELWWGGQVGSWQEMPIDETSDFSLNLRLSGKNQTAPLFLSNKGRVIFSKSVFTVDFKGGSITLDGEDEINIIEAGNSLKDAYRYACNNLYSFEENRLDDIYFNAPQYNTWVQMGYMQNEEGVLKYAHSLIDNGYKPGIIMIDEGWQKDYGNWMFNERFPNAEKMVTELHSLGFKVMLWVVPYISTDIPIFRNMWFKANEHLCRTFDDQPAIDHWWNGYSCSFNLALAGDREVLGGQLKNLMENYGIDGFKFDGGNISSYRLKAVNGQRKPKYMPETLNMAWNDFGHGYKYLEFKDTFNRMGKSVPQRINDTKHQWKDNGIDKLIPSGLMQNLLGYPYNCPDMIGGGCINAIGENIFTYDGELFVRTAQLSAFFPIMQFSAAPFEVLEKEYSDLVLAAADLHIKLSDYIIKLVDKASKTSEPIMQHMEYAYPNKGYERITSQFMLGEDLLVAPVTEKGQTVKRVVLPDGKWKSPDGEIFAGGKEIDYPAPLNVVPYFERIK